MNKTDLAQFNDLVNSSIRSEEREQALHKWNAYKLSRQMAYEKHQKKANQKGILWKSGVWTKGDYIKSLTAPAIDLRGAKLKDVCVGYVDLRGALLDDIEFSSKSLYWSAMKGANLESASLKRAIFPGIRLMEADLRNADCTRAKFIGADLTNVNFAGATLKDADLSSANLEGVNLVGANVEGCKMDEARVYGVSAWDLKGQPKSSKNLIVTPFDFPEVTVDNIEVAQFIYLILNNEKIKGVLDTITSKGVLILGRFSLSERKKVLNSIRDKLREYDFVPIVFDFEKATSRDFTETIKILAGMSRFIIADVTNPKSAPLELQAIVPDYQIPLVPIIQEGEDTFSMFNDLYVKYGGEHGWVMDPYEYKSCNELLDAFKEVIIDRAWDKHQELLLRKSRSFKVLKFDDFRKKEERKD